MASFTPGPWMYSGGYPAFVAAPDDDEPGNALKAMVCELDNRLERYQRPDDEVNANGRLIAATPALAEALADFVQERGECMGDPEWTGPGCAYYSFGRGELCPWCKGMAALDSAGLLNPETGEPI